MSRRPLVSFVGSALSFFVPNIQGRQYRPGRQPNNPGESHIDSGNPHFGPIPWPNTVGTINALSSHPGVPRGRALQIDNNQEAVLPSNYLFLAGFVGKSRG